MACRLPILAGFVVGLPLIAACHTARASDDTPAPAGSTNSSQRSSAGATAPATVGTDPGHAGAGTPLTPIGHDRLAAFAAGCFWGVEDAYRHVPGVVATAVGYAGGRTTDPSYRSVSSHTTGHAETVLVEYDPTRVSYDQLLRVFWQIHDPTQVDGQGPDIGSNYRSIIFTFDPEQAAASRASQRAAQSTFSEPITTEIRPIGAFYKAESYHQQYAERTGHHGCPVRLPVNSQ